MQKRIEAMIAAVATVQPPLEKFFGLLSDEQKARLTALGENPAKARQATTTEVAHPELQRGSIGRDRVANDRSSRRCIRPKHSARVDRAPERRQEGGG